MGGPGEGGGRGRAEDARLGVWARRWGRDAWLGGGCGGARRCAAGGRRALVSCPSHTSCPSLSLALTPRTPSAHASARPLSLAPPPPDPRRPGTHAGRPAGGHRARPRAGGPLGQQARRARGGAAQVARGARGGQRAAARPRARGTCQHAATAGALRARASAPAHARPRACSRLVLLELLKPSTRPTHTHARTHTHTHTHTHTLTPVSYTHLARCCWSCSSASTPSCSTTS